MYNQIFSKVALEWFFKKEDRKFRQQFKVYLT